MGLFDRFFAPPYRDEGPSDIRFGRYSDAYKEEAHYAMWNNALAAFDQKDYLVAYEHFLGYLLDPSLDNVTYTRSGGRIEFEIIQGSKKLTGVLTEKMVGVVSKVAKMDREDPALLQHLLEYNYQLRFCRFSISEDDHICMTFDSSIIDGSPFKLYYALKEMASHADKRDDLLIHDFPCLSHVDNDLFQEIPLSRKEIMYRYLQEEIQKLLDYINDQHQLCMDYPGGIAYMLLALAYKLDYLIKPEGFLMDQLEEVNTIFFANEDTTPEYKIQRIIEIFQKILDHDASLLKSEMYITKSTFGITTSVSQDRISNFIEGELSNMDWYLDNDFQEVACAIPEFIIGYSLFHYAAPLPVQKLLQLYYRITEDTYFQKLGFSRSFHDEKDRLDKKSIRAAIDQIKDDFDESYPLLSPDTAMLKYGSRASFGNAYLKMIQLLDISRAVI